MNVIYAHAELPRFFLLFYFPLFLNSISVPGHLERTMFAFILTENSLQLHHSKSLIQQVQTLTIRAMKILLLSTHENNSSPRNYPTCSIHSPITSHVHFTHITLSLFEYSFSPYQSSEVLILTVNQSAADNISQNY